MKSLPQDWLEILVSNSYWNPDTLAKRFFNHDNAEIDFRDGTIHTGRAWADEDQTADFYHWVNWLGGEGVTNG